MPLLLYKLLFDSVAALRNKNGRWVVLVMGHYWCMHILLTVVLYEFMEHC